MKHPRRRTDVNSQVVEGETVVLDRHHEFINQLNLTATYIWERCDGNASPEDIAATLLRRLRFRMRWRSTMWSVSLGTFTTYNFWKLSPSNPLYPKP